MSEPTCRAHCPARGFVVGGVAGSRGTRSRRYRGNRSWSTIPRWSPGFSIGWFTTPSH